MYPNNPNQTASGVSTIIQDGETLRLLQEVLGAATEVRDIVGTKHVLVPAGWQHVDLTEAVRKAQTMPDRASGTIVLGALESFVAYCKAAVPSWPDSRVYANPTSRTLTCIFNDHGPTRPGWRDFKAQVTANLSAEFALWTKSNKQQMSQEAFADFIEANHADITDSQGDVLLRVATTLQAKTGVEFKSSRRLDNGQVQLTYHETIDARAADGALEIPREFALGVRLFENGQGYRIQARLKYRLGGGSVKFWYELDRPERAIEDAFRAYIDTAGEIGVPVLISG